MGPLDGVKVVELATHVAMPIAARIMGDWGAHVIKIENPKGDPWRLFGFNYGIPITDEENIIFSMQNSNKELISIDLKDEKGREVLFKLLEDADVFLTNVRNRSLAKLGLDHEALMAKFPKLVYYYFNGYGEKGAMKDVPGFDLAAFWSSCGILKGWSFEGQLPPMPSCGFGDMVCGSMIANGVLAALYSAKNTGKGVYATSSLYGTGIWYNYGDVMLRQPQYAKRANRPPVYERCGNPFTWIYRCGDGESVFMGGLDFNTAYDKCMRVLGLEEIMDDPVNRNPKSRVNGAHPLFPIVLETFKKKSAAEWAKLFAEADIVCQRLMGAEEVYRSQQAWDNEYLTEVDYSCNGYKTALPNSPVHFEGFDVKPSHQVAGVGSDSVKILKDHGFTDEQIDFLIKNKSVIAK